MTELIHIEPYDPHWPARFADESERVRAVLAGEALAIEHVGSTAVPGLAAKPIIDMVLECTSYPPSAAVEQALAALGYEARGEFGVPGRHFYSKGNPRCFHIHVVPRNGEVLRRTVAFRNYLREHPEAAAQYAAIKREAAPGQPLGSQAYVLAKGPFVETILALAKAG